MKRRLLLLLIFALCQLAALAGALRMAWALLANPARAWRLAVAYDQLANTAANGDEDETISSRAAKARRHGRRWGCLLCRLLDHLDPEHCNRSIEADEGEAA